MCNYRTPQVSKKNHATDRTSGQVQSEEIESMAVVNSYFLQPPAYHHSSTSELEAEELTEGNVSDSDDVKKQHNLLVSRELAKSVESLTSLLSSLPDIVIPETLHNPLPLQCLAASALPESISEEIDQVLKEFSVKMATSPRRLQEREGPCASPVCEGEPSLGVGEAKELCSAEEREQPVAAGTAGQKEEPAIVSPVAGKSETGLNQVRLGQSLEALLFSAFGITNKHFLETLVTN